MAETKSPVARTGATAPGVSPHFGTKQGNPEGLALAKGEGGSNPDPNPTDADFQETFGKKTGADNAQASGRGTPGVGDIPEPEAAGDAEKPAQISSGNKEVPSKEAKQLKAEMEV